MPVSSRSMNEARFVTAFAERLRAAPHRDLTHVAYAEWLNLFVSLTKQLSAGANDASGSRPHRRLVDSMLWSSLVAPRWDAVDLLLDECAVNDRLRGPSRAAASVETVSEQMWFRRTSQSTGLCLADVLTSAVGKAGASDSVDTVEVAPALRCDMVTSDFLVEPLLGGQCIETWRQELRQQSEWLNTVAAARSASGPSSTVDVADGAGTTDGESLRRDVPSVIVVPFSTLWMIKEQAFLRTSPASATTTRPLTMQERGARQILLQSLHQVMQLQVELNDKRRSLDPVLAASAKVTAPRLQLAVLAPSEEFSLLCVLPQLRRAQQQQRQSVGEAVTDGAAEPPCLQLSTVCENSDVRLTFFLYCQLMRGLPATSWHLVAPTSLHTTFRRHAAGALQSLPLCAQPLFQAQRLEVGSVGGLPRSIHRQARQGCHDTVRRMTQREENLRQSYSQK